MSVEIDKTARVHPTTRFNGDASVGFCSYVGYEAHEATETESVCVGDSVHIGAFCLIEGGVHLAGRVEVDHYCRISCGSRIGTGTRVLYRAQIFDEVSIGENCIIAGELVDRTVVEDWVRFQGETAHSYADTTGDWDDTVEPSPIIKRGSVVGVGAILIGGITIGPRAYVAAGERVTCDVPEGMVLRDGKLRPIADCHGLIKLRDV